MDTCTHALLGAAVAYLTRTSRSRLNARERLSIGAAAGAFPDVDFLFFPLAPLRFLADWHQGPTHSLILLPLWAILIGIACVTLTRRRECLVEAVLVAAAGLATHIASDLITAYGTAVLYPLSAARWSLNATFVIDPLFTGIVLIALALGLRTSRRLPVALGLAMLCLYVGGQVLLRERALEAGRSALRTHGLSVGHLTALPQPFSPFNWKLIDTHDTYYRSAYLNIAGHPPLVPALPGLDRLRALASTYRAAHAITWATRHRYGDVPELRPLVAQRFLDPKFDAFRRFATHPGVSRIDREGTAICIWFSDLRYDLPAIPDTFRYGFCRDAETAPWRFFRIRYFSENALQPLY